MSRYWLTRVSLPTGLLSVSGGVNQFCSPGESHRRQQNRGFRPGGPAGGTGLDPGMIAPDFTLPRLGGGEGSLSDYRGRPVLLVFVRLRCPTSRNIVPRLNRLQSHGELQIVVVHRGRTHEATLWAEDLLAGVPVFVQPGPDESMQYRFSGTPFAFLIDERGRLVSSSGQLHWA